MRTVFLGTPDIAVPTLRAMAESEDFRPLAVFTQPAARRSRRGKATSSAVGTAARELGLEVVETDAVSRDEAFEKLREIQPEVIVVVAFGQILKKRVLELPRYGCLNFHPSMLPKYRGAAPVQRAVLDGVVDGGLSVMRLVKKMDAGPTLLQRDWRMDPAKNAEQLLIEAGEIGASMMIDVLGRLEVGITETPQDEERVTFAPMLSKEDGIIDWQATSDEIVNRIRAVQPWPRGQAWLEGDIRMIIHSATAGGPAEAGVAGEVLDVNKDGIVVACGKSTVCLTEVQLEGKPRKPARDVANGLRLKVGAKFRI